MADNLFKDSLYTSEWIGVIIDNKDPEFRGRCRIKIFGLFTYESDSDEYYKKNNEEIPLENIPWFTPTNNLIFAGGNSFGNISIPKMGTFVKVRFPHGERYVGEYYSIQEPNLKMSELIKNDYENAHVLLFDQDKNLKLYYTQNNGISFKIHSDDKETSGSKINLNNTESSIITHKNNDETESSTIKLTFDDILIKNSKDEKNYSSINLKNKEMLLKTTNDDNDKNKSNVHLKISELILNNNKSNITIKSDRITINHGSHNEESLIYGETFVNFFKQFVIDIGLIAGIPAIGITAPIATAANWGVILSKYSNDVTYKSLLTKKI